MIRPAEAFLALAALALPATAVTFEPSSGGYTEFTMPSNNVGCIVTMEDGMPMIACDRVAPSYKRVRMFATGKPKLFTDAGDASCCGAENYFPYGSTWIDGDFTCTSATTGLTCTNGPHGFSMNRKAIKIW